MADFDAIVVGSGCAGAVAAHELASAQKNTLVIERGERNGAKNMSGGRLYTHSLAAVFPEYKTEAPLERRIAHERLSFITDDACTTVDFSSGQMLVPNSDSYSVLRAEFDEWLSSKAESAGAEYINGIAVEGLLKDDSGRVIGVRAGDDEISADIVILADGVNSLLSKEAVGFKAPLPSTMAVGIKQVIELPEAVISDRLLSQDGDGAAWLFVGDATHGHIGGGFMYTNRASISLGLVATISDLFTAKRPIYQMLEDLKAHSAVAPLIKGGKVVEHSGHMVPEGGLKMMPPLTADGVMLAGESAMMCINLGYMVRGMDYAIAAGMHAGRAAAAALNKGDTSAAGLADYQKALEDSFVLQDLRQFSGFPHFMESTTRLFKEYPQMLSDVMNTLFVVDGRPVAPLKKSLKPIVKQVGLINMLKDVRGGIKAL
ncbi:MAG: NAD(P)/FAD-dependent oxidoreductase [Coriobacteriales bacterium]|jgi:electron transfer flavoprotein-quinone oxidoreductase|nr:NAD(P)/FAD-dependent oxidoreductase [Coriobacteriales bacterium]